MNSTDIVQALNAHVFDTGDIQLTFGLAPALVFPHPFNPTIAIYVGTRKLYAPVLEEAIREVQHDLNCLRRTAPEIRKFGIWYWQAPGENAPGTTDEAHRLRNDLLRYAKGTG
jgi:hypothetical protein